MSEVRGLVGHIAMRLPGCIGQRVRFLFTVFAIVVAPISGLGLLVEDVPVLPHGLVASAALLAAAGWAWSLYRWNGLPWWTDPVPVLALVAAGWAIDSAGYVWGLLFVLLFVRMLYGSGPRLLVNAVSYFVAFEVSVFLVDGWAGLTFVDIGTLALGVAFSAGVMVSVGRVVRDYEAVLHREQVLARTGSRLQRAADHDEIYAVAEEMGLQLLDDVPGAVLTFWRGDAQTIWLRHGAGPMAQDTPLEVPMARFPSEIVQRMRAGDTCHLDRDATRDVQSAVEMEAIYAAMILAPFLRGGAFGGVLAVASREHVPAGLVTAFDRLATDVGLALDRADSHLLLHRVVENSSDAIVLLDHDGRVRFASSAAGTIFGAPPEDLGDRKLHELLDMTDGDLTARLHAAVDDAAQGWRSSVPVGVDQQRQIEIVAARTQGGGGGWVVNLRDVSQRVAHERELERSEARFRSLAENVTEGIYQMSLVPHVRFDYVNPAMERMCGFVAEDFLADADITAGRVHPDDLPLVQRTREAPDEVDFPVEVRWRHPSGEWVWHSLRETVIHDAEGRAVSTIGVFSDITARKQQAQALEAALDQERHAAERLRRVDAMRTTFIQAVSHELRTPLTAISGYARTLREHHERLDTETLVTLLERLDWNADKLDCLLADLLDVDRLSSHVLEPSRRPVDVIGLVRDMVGQLESASHPVVCNGDELTANLDAPKVERIVENLVRNAMKHTPAGTPIIVTVAADDDGDGVMLTVADEGEGVPDELLDQVFEPFAQGPASATAAAPGMGIGLSLVARFAELHSGHALVRNRDDGGAVFEVWLPGRCQQQDSNGDVRRAVAAGSR